MPELVLFSCALAALYALPLAADDEVLAASEGTALDSGAPATFSSADIDGDGRLARAAVSREDVFQLLAAAGEGCLEEVSVGRGR